MKSITDIFANNPSYGGLFFIIIGIILIVLAITNPDWYLGDSKDFNIEKVQGWANLFGRNFTRVLVGLMGIAIIGYGLFRLWLINK